MEGLPASNATIYVDTVNARVSIGTGTAGQTLDVRGVIRTSGGIISSGTLVAQSGVYQAGSVAEFQGFNSIIYLISTNTVGNTTTEDAVGMQGYDAGGNTVFWGAVAARNAVATAGSSYGKLKLEAGNINTHLVPMGIYGEGSFGSADMFNGDSTAGPGPQIFDVHGGVKAQTLNIGVNPSNVPLVISSDTAASLGGTARILSQMASTTGTRGIYIAYDTSVQKGILASPGSSSSMTFWTNGAERMILDGNANLTVSGGSVTASAFFGNGSQLSGISGNLAASTTTVIPTTSSNQATFITCIATVTLTTTGSKVQVYWSGILNQSGYSSTNVRTKFNVLQDGAYVAPYTSVLGITGWADGGQNYHDAVGSAIFQTAPSAASHSYCLSLANDSAVALVFDAAFSSPTFGVIEVK